ncbi:Phloem protein [Trema orientale]|uniref:Phloem protein n=1 Tax=Trema orientale TaxID=63057 RepID=A0A2P5FAQ3_TREOI|nr:Phloem protein [Trema orientale]
MKHQENQVEQCMDHDALIRSNFSSLPEDLISLILSKTSTRDACRLSVVSSQFRSAASSDLVWESFLPSHYTKIISRCNKHFASKKDIYISLFRGIVHIDHDNKVCRYNLRGKVFCGLDSKNLTVTANHPRPNSWFILNPEASSYLTVNFGHGFNIKGKVDTGLLSPNTNYQVCVCYNPTEVKGYNSNEFSSSCPPITVSVKLFKEGKIVKTSELRINLVMTDTRSSFRLQEVDKWTDLTVGKFFNNTRDFDAVEVSLMETKRLNFYKGPAIKFYGIGFRGF